MSNFEMPENPSRMVMALFLCLLVCAQSSLSGRIKLSSCSKSKEGNKTLYRKVTGDDGFLICLKKSGQYVWTFMDGSSSLGEKFNPARDCSDIVDNRAEAKDGFYWIKSVSQHLLKTWCDTHTDGGGFALVGVKHSSVTWNVPSNENPVDPFGSPHWSSEFGNVSIQDFAIQISTSKNFEDTKAHWSYRLGTKRGLGNLLGAGNGGCTDFHSGIGDVSYVKDILTETVVTRNFSCSQFGPNQDVNLGWGRMNYCLRNKCPKGYAFLKGVPFRLDSHGSFSYSTTSQLSGVTHDTTAFVGCDHAKCCACFGPKGGRGHYCGRKCTALNGGTVLTGEVYVWYWVRTRIPKRVWKRCMEFKMKNEGGKPETYFIDRKTGTARKGTCSAQFETFLNEGTLLVKNKESLDNLPRVPGLVSYREDNEKLYLSKKDGWDAIGSENETKNVMSEVTHLGKKLMEQRKLQSAKTRSVESNVTKRLLQLEKKMNLELENIKVKKLPQIEQSLKARLRRIEIQVPYIGKWPSGHYCILANGACPTGFSRSYGYLKAIRLYSGNSHYVRTASFGDSRIQCHGNHCNHHWPAELHISACCK